MYYAVTCTMRVASRATAAGVKALESGLKDLGCRAQHAKDRALTAVLRDLGTKGKSRVRI